MLCYQGHTVVENRHGLVVRAQVSHATGTAERDTALELLQSLPGKRRKTVGADKGYDVKSFVKKCRELRITAYVAAKDKGSATVQRTRACRLHHQPTQAKTRGGAVRLGQGDRPDPASQAARQGAGECAVPGDHDGLEPGQDAQSPGRKQRVRPDHGACREEDTVHGMKIDRIIMPSQTKTRTARGKLRSWGRFSTAC